MTAENPASAEAGALVLLGGAGGLGGEVVRGYLRAAPSASVWITYAGDAASAHALRDEVGTGTVVQCDVTEPDSLAQLAAQVQASGHRVQALVHAAVAARRGELLGAAPELLSALDVSAVSLVRAVTAFDDLLHDGASVTYLTSIGATRVMPHYAFVGVAKAAAEAMVRYLSVELGQRGVRINAVGCGPVATKALSNFADPAKLVDYANRRSPLQPPVSPSEVADVIAFLSSPTGRGFTGQVINLDGGLTLWV